MNNRIAFIGGGNMARSLIGGLLAGGFDAASIRVAEKCGYQYEGTHRQIYFLRGRYIDCNSYSQLRHEYTPLEEALKM